MQSILQATAMPDIVNSTSSPPNNALELAFARLPRPQKVLDINRPCVPVKSSFGLAEARAQSPQLSMPPPPAPAKVSAPTPPKRSTSTESVADENILQKTVTLGRFAQDSVEWVVRAHRSRGLVMIKKVNGTTGLAEKQILDQIQQRNIAAIVYSLWEGDSLCLAIEYCRYTLAQILHVHLKLEEVQTQYVARSIFSALIYLGTRGITHHRICAQSIRFTPDFRVVLTNFSHATTDDPELYSNKDLIDLAFVLLECMEGHLIPDGRRKVEFVKEQRAANKVFGLTEPEHWSGSKQLIDFLDELFNEKRSAQSKLSKPHQFTSYKEDALCMRHYIELVSFECSFLWVPGTLT